MSTTLLHLDSSARRTGSVTRDLSARVVSQLAPDTVLRRDLAMDPLPQVSEDWVTANFTPADHRSDAQKALLAQSDTLVDELLAADTIVIGLPVYNFGVPAALKAWIDLVARVGRTFHYTESGPVGHLSGKRVIVALASGGTQADGVADFATPYLRHVLGFLGITDVTVASADQMAKDAEAALAAANSVIDDLAA